MDCVICWISLAARRDSESVLPAIYSKHPSIHLDAIPPCFDQTALPSGQASRKQLNRVDLQNTDIVLMESVKVRRVVVRACDPHVHANDDAEEPDDLWDSLVLSTRVPAHSAPGHSSKLRFKADLQRF